MSKLPKIVNRKSGFINLKDYCHFAKENDFLELTQWGNGEGVDIDINGDKKISMTSGEIDAVIAILKSLEIIEEYEGI